MVVGKEKDTPFNMAMLFYVSLNKFIIDKNVAYINGNLWTWHRILTAIYRTIIFKIDTKVREEIEKDLKKAQRYLNCVAPEAMKDQFLSITEKRIEENLDKVDKALTGVMDENNMIFPKIELTGGFEKIKKDLGLLK